MLFPEEIGNQERTFAIQPLTYHHVIDKVVWVSLTPNNELCSRLGESGINYEIYLLYKAFFPRYTVNLDAPSCANREVLEVDGLNFWVFLPVHLKQRHSPIVASHLKYGNKPHFCLFERHLRGQLWRLGGTLLRGSLPPLCGFHCSGPERFGQTHTFN